jgi:ketosteroid isomerase-like protein
MAPSPQRIRDLYAAFSRGDIEIVLSFLTEDVDWYAPGAAPFSGRRTGRNQVRHYFDELARLVRFDEFDLDDVLIDADKAVAMGRERVLVKETGRHFETAWVHVFIFRGGLVSEVRLYLDTHAVAAAFGESAAERAALTGPLGVTHPAYSGGSDE